MASPSLSSRIRSLAGRFDGSGSGSGSDGTGSDAFTATVGNTMGSSNYRSVYPISKDVSDSSGIRRGTTPQHIADPIQGNPRSFNPLALSKLAESETIQQAEDTILKDLRAVPLNVVPRDREEIETLPNELIEQVERVLDDPNPNYETIADIIEMWGRDALRYGNFVAVLSFNIDGRRAEIMPYDPNTFTVEWDDNRVLEGFYQYSYRSQRFGSATPFDPETVIWGTYNPETERDGFYGHSPLEKVARVINILGQLVEKEIQDLEKGAPSGIISLIGDSWGKSDYQHFETVWKNEMRGQRHKIGRARGQIEYVPFEPNYEQLQILDRQKWYAKLVGAVYGLPVSESGLSIGESANRATDVAQRQKYKTRTLGSLLSIIEQAINSQFVWPFWSDRVRVKFDLGLDLMEKRELANIHATQLDYGLRTVNEIREQQGKDPVPWGHKPFDLRTYARSNTGGSGGGFSPGPALPGGGGPSDREQSQSPEAEQQNAQNEGLRQDTTATNDGGRPQGTAKRAGRDLDFPNGGSRGYWLPPANDHEQAHHSHTAKALDRDDLDDSESKDAILSLVGSLEGLYREVIGDVIGDLKANQQLLRDTPGGFGPIDKEGDPNRGNRVSKGSGERPAREYVAKEPSGFHRIIKKNVGVEFAEDIADILVDAKNEQITAGEQDIADELAAAGLSASDFDLGPIRDRVTERINNRTFEVTKPISERLEADLREVLREGWDNGLSITEIEDRIGDLSGQWEGYEAERLARDQIGRAHKEARHEYAGETGDLVGGWVQEWLTTGGSSGDGRTRESHKLMDGVTVPQAEPWEVDYTPDGGPANVQEDYPGDSRYGIQCRCDFKLSPAPQVAKAREWASEPTDRMRQVAKSHGKPVDAVLRAAERRPGGREKSAQFVGVAKQTYYNWIKEAGIY